MARKTIRVKIPVGAPDKLSKLANNVKAKDDDMADTSPLKDEPSFDRTDFAAKLSAGDTKRKESEKLREQAETKMEQARTAYGTGNGQTAETPGTVYNYIVAAKDRLLSYYKTNPEMLSEWGFDVVVGEAKTPKPQNPKTP